MDEFNKTKESLRKGLGSPPKRTPRVLLSDIGFHEDVKMRRFRLRRGRCFSFPSETSDMSPSQILVVKVKAKIDQQISPLASKRNIVKPIAYVVNREKRPMRMQLQTADSMPSFECPFNIIKNIQKIHAEKLMKEHAASIKDEGESSPKPSTHLQAFKDSQLSPGDIKKSLSSIELHPLKDKVNKVKSADDVNDTSNDSLYYRELLHYFTGQARISRGSIEEFHRASQPDLFLMCLSKMRSDEVLASKTNSTKSIPRVVEHLDDDHDTPTPISTPSCDTDTDYRVSDDRLAPVFLPSVSSPRTSHGNSEVDASNSSFTNERFVTTSLSNTATNATTNATTNDRAEDHNMNRCDSIPTASGTQMDNTSVHTTIELPTTVTAQPTLGPEIAMDDSHFTCTDDVHWSIYIRHSVQPVSLSVVSTNTSLPNMTGEQLHIYKRFIGHLGLLHKKGVEVFEETYPEYEKKATLASSMIPTIVFNKQPSPQKLRYEHPLASTDILSPINKQPSPHNLRYEHPLVSTDMLGANNNGPVSVTGGGSARGYCCYDTQGLQSEFKSLESDKMIRLQIENTGLRIKNRDMCLKLKRAEEIMNLCPGDNEDGSVLDQLLKNGQHYMQELERVNAVIHHDKAIIKDLDHAQQQLIDDYSNRENELEVQMQHVMNELDLLRNKYRSLEEENDDMYEDRRHQDEELAQLRQKRDTEKAEADSHLKEMEEQIQSKAYARDRANDAMAEDLRRVTADLTWATTEKEELEKENTELSEENAAQNQFINELQVDLAVAETKVQTVYDCEERVQAAEQLIQEQVDDLLAWEQEYGLLSSRVNELLETAAELRGENHTLRLHVQELDSELDEIADINDQLREQLENRSVQSDGSFTVTEIDGVPQTDKRTDKQIIAQLRDEAAANAEQYNKACKDVKKQEQKTNAVKDQLLTIQNMHDTYQQHMNFKYKNIVREFKKKAQFYEGENAKLSNQIQNIIYTNETLNHVLSKKNIEITKLTDDLTSAEHALKQISAVQRKTEEQLSIEQDHQFKLAAQNQELIDRINSMKNQPSKREAEGDAVPAYVKQLNKMVAALGESIQSVEVSQKRTTNKKREESVQICELKNTITNLEGELSTERVMHEVTKKSLKMAEEDIARLRQNTRSIYTRSSAADTRGNRNEQIANKIKQHQARAQYLLGMRSAVTTTPTPRTSSSLI